MTKADQLAELYEIELLQADGFDDAILGVVFDHMNAVPRIAYSISKSIKILMERDGMSWEEAQEYFDFNVQGAYIGEKTPVWVDDHFIGETP